MEEKKKEDVKTSDKSNWDYKTGMAPALSQEFKDAYIISIQGKSYITVNGLLALAHMKGFKSMKTDLVQFPNKENDNVAIFKCEVIGYGWDAIAGKITEVSFVSYADASPKTVNSKIAPHFIRMAETRAIGRVLRNYTNVGMTALEELGSIVEIEKVTPTQINQVSSLMTAKGQSKDQVKAKFVEICGKDDLREATIEEAQDLIAWLKQL